MADDLLTRLRRAKSNNPMVAVRDLVPIYLTSEAADEIERLRYLIFSAMHDRRCEVWDSAGYMRVQNPKCTCFKAQVDHD